MLSNISWMNPTVCRNGTHLILEVTESVPSGDNEIAYKNGAVFLPAAL